MTWPSSLALLALAAGLTACGGASTGATPSAADSGFVAVPGAKLFYKSVGNRQPIIVVHGGPGMDHTYLLPGMLGLARNHRLIFYDQRGSGRTEGDVNATTVSFDRFLADIDALRDSLDLGRPVLLGHSWGGLVAMRYAAKYPDKLRALILMNTVEPGRRYADASTQMMREKRTTEDSIEIARISATPELRRRDTSAVNAIFRAMFRPLFADRSLVSQLAINLDARTAANMATVATLVMGPVAGQDFWSEAGTIRVPTLIVQGAQDAMPLAMVRDLAATIKMQVDELPTEARNDERSTQLAIIEGAGHFPYIEKPNETFGAINSFLARVRTSSVTSPDGKVPFAIPRRP